jgi:hypothetical protein
MSEELMAVRPQLYTPKSDAASFREDVNAIQLLQNWLREHAAFFFAGDNRIRALSVGWSRRFGYGLRITRNLDVREPMVGEEMRRFMREFRSIPVYNAPAQSEIVPCLEVLPEQLGHRPPACGIQIQNYDDDDRTGRLARRTIKVGTLGCFVRRDGDIFLLSCNHVIAANNSGLAGKDRILNPGDHNFDPKHHFATLEDFPPLRASPPSARQNFHQANLNKVDAALARLHDSSHLDGGFVASRSLSPPYHDQQAYLFGDEPVFKIGRSSGFTEGIARGIKGIMGPIPYDGVGECWFEDVIEIESVDDEPFCVDGDSGAVVFDGSGRSVGLLFATNGKQAYCCSIQSVVGELNVSF